MPRAERKYWQIKIRFNSLILEKNSQGAPQHEIDALIRLADQMDLEQDLECMDNPLPISKKTLKKGRFNSNTRSGRYRKSFRADYHVNNR